MIGSLLRPRRKRGRVDRSPFSSPFNTASRNVTNDAPLQHARSVSSDQEEGHARIPEREPLAYRHHESEYSVEDEDEDREPLLPIFSSAHLDELPLYNITHAIRILVMQRCETTLSWDQLRSPQISQFLVKPIQSAIRADHFNRASMSALLANCLQFGKEAETSLGNFSINKTRAILCELLAMRLLKDFSSRELIDALSYDFDPLQGMTDSRNASPGDTSADKAQVRQSAGARISAVEIAIRANAKRFLAHPLVVQQLQAIWAGNIVFHSAADNLHRVAQPSSPPAPAPATSYGAIGPATDAVETPKKHVSAASYPPAVRRTVTLYDPRDASLFKLSRLRVPRYRQIFSTMSFSIMLGLYLAVLVDRSLSITPLEVLFWFWSTGYMLDELVGFNEQGFGLYIMSVWNAFDLGILILFFAYYILRLYGILMPDIRKHVVANMAYDVLATTAVLLFPRAFSVLDNYRYFSQLLIAFRLMAQDLAAVFGLIVVCCSGFYVAFALSFMSEYKSGSDVAYIILQIVMGFTPAVWDNWTKLNLLGKLVMGVFLSLCHFLIVTILITVLTNSFMAIVQNSNEEHQFLLAVNTISMVKSDALFSYVAPSNILAWLISPLRYIMPFRQFVKFNRYIIKLTHFPILLTIFLYERLILSSFANDTASDFLDLPRREAKPGFLGLRKGSRGRRLREPSIVSFRKDRALNQVFRQPFASASAHTPASRHVLSEHGHSVDAVDNWIRRVGNASPPMEQPQSVLDRLETRRPLLRRTTTTDNTRRLQRDFSTATRSVISEPEDRLTMAGRRRRPLEIERSPAFKRRHEETDADDELLTNDEGDTFTLRSHHGSGQNVTSDKFAAPATESQASASLPKPALDRSLSHAARARLLDAPASARKPGRRTHDRNISNDTIVFQPPVGQAPLDGPSSGARTPLTETRSAPKPMLRSRPAMAPRGQTQLGTDFMGQLQSRGRGRAYREPSFNAIALDLASDLGDNRIAPDTRGAGNISVSFSEHVFNEMERGRDLKRRREEEERARQEQEEKAMVGRIMLARMNTLEEGFREMLKEVKEMKNADAASTRPPLSENTAPATPLASNPSWLRTGGTPMLERQNSADSRPKGTRKKLFSRRSKGKEPEKSPAPAPAPVPTPASVPAPPAEIQATAAGGQGGSPQPPLSAPLEQQDDGSTSMSVSRKRESMASSSAAERKGESESKRSSVIFRGRPSSSNDAAGGGES